MVVRAINKKYYPSFTGQVTGGISMKLHMSDHA
jgi:hypothetical protein